MPNLFDGQYQNLASKGRYGDTMLAHINPQEAALLKARGGSGTINPQTGLPEFYGMDQMERMGLTQAPYQAPFGTYDMRGSSPAAPAPFDIGFADIEHLGMGSSIIRGYNIPTEKKFKDIPLISQYDPKGNFNQYTLEPGKYITPDPNHPNIVSVPKFDANGKVIDWGISDLNNQDSGGFGSFVSGLVSDFGPMILAGLGANYLSGSGLLSNAAGATTGGLTAAELAAGSTANFMNPALISTAGGAGGAAATAAGAGLLSSGATTAATTAATDAAAAAAAEAASAGGILGGGSTALTGGIAPEVVGGITASTVGQVITPSILESISAATGISVDTLKTFGPSVIQGLASAAGSVLTGNQAKDAAQTQADAQIKAAQIAADAARFRPVGVTTRFGSSNFKTDAAGNVTGAGYTPSAEILGYQNRLSTLANQGLTDAEAARAAYQPLTGAAQSLFGLGQSYLAKTPEQVAQDYINKQQALLAPSQENQLALLQNKLQQQGRGGLSVAQGGNFGATSPEMQAYYNSLAQSNLVLAANADQEAQNRIKFGAGLFDTGANLQGRYYTGQTAAYSPFTTPMDTSSGLERLAQQPLDLSTSIGQKVSTANANVGQLTSQGIINAANTMAPANAYSAAGNLLSGAANSPVLANAVNKAFGNTSTDQATINQQLIDILLNRKQTFVA
jgi:hypothetical protein